METETINKTPVWKYILISLAVFLSVIFIYYTIMNMIGTGKKVRMLNDEYKVKQDEKKKQDERLFSDSTFLKLFKEKSFLQSRVSMAETDSIYLTINLADSSVDLEISGVAVHSAKFTRLKISKILEDKNSFIISSLLSKPLNIENNYSSIPKVPLMIKMAPKDTSEYKPDIIPDTADYEPVNYIMEMDNGIRMMVYQEEKLNPGDGMHLFWFDLKYRLRDTWESIKNVSAFKVPEYHPFIKLRLPRTDSKIIYRALPEHGQIAVYR